MDSYFQKDIMLVLFQSYHRATREGQVLIYGRAFQCGYVAWNVFVFSILILSWVHSGYVSCDITTD